jgi:hypothetical protein
MRIPSSSSCCGESVTFSDQGLAWQAWSPRVWGAYLSIILVSVSFEISSFPSRIFTVVKARFTGLTPREWALQARTRLEQFKDPPPLGKDSQQLTDVIGAARTDAQARP